MWLLEFTEFDDWIKIHIEIEINNHILQLNMSTPSNTWMFPY